MRHRRKLFFDEKRMSSDVADVLEGAALLQVTEFEFFRIAYRRWFGADIDDHRLERHYLRDPLVPHAVGVALHQSPYLASHCGSRCFLKNRWKSYVCGAVLLGYGVRCVRGVRAAGCRRPDA